MTPKQEAIRAAVIKAVPSIMELKFGCKLKRGENIGRWRDDYKKGFRNIGGEVYADVWDDFYGLSQWPIEEIEILGRPIRLADIFYCLEYQLKNKQKIVWDARESLVKHIVYKWNLLDDDLSHQSPETINFLYSLLCQN